MFPSKQKFNYEIKIYNKISYCFNIPYLLTFFVHFEMEGEKLSLKNLFFLIRKLNRVITQIEKQIWSLIISCTEKNELFF